MKLGNKIAIIGNAGGGKSTLARKIGQTLKLPVTHVDSIEYQSEWQHTPEEESDPLLAEIAAGKQWVIDGFGSMKSIEQRIELADTAIHIDFPFWRHLWWIAKRQSNAHKGQRIELPDNCPEFSLIFTRELVKYMWKVHKEQTPEFRKFMMRKKSQLGNGLVIRTPAELNRLSQAVESAQGPGNERRTKTEPASRSSH